MTDQIKKPEDIFHPSVISTREFIRKPGQGCYIPAYQRPYAWDKKNILRLFEDVLDGIRRLFHRENSLNFFGTIIAIDDREHRTIRHTYHSRLPSRVMVIIDGQQRICSAVMSNIALHDYISRCALDFERKTELHFLWINNECTKLLKDLEMTYLLKEKDENSIYSNYPRIIRDYSDVWSTEKREAKYESPIAKLIWKYICFRESIQLSEPKFNPAKNGNLIDDDKIVFGTFKVIQREVKNICELNSETHPFPDLVDTINTTEADFSKRIWDKEPTEEVKDYIINNHNDINYNSFCNLFRAIIFARYLNDCIAIALVTASNEDDAFDMFEALNTTGQLLTAFETFKPKVIELENISEYEGSDSHNYITRIEKYLNRSKTAVQKQRATSEMLISFALMETGSRLSKDLNDQRRYLRTEFDRLSISNGATEKRNFVKSIAHVASFFQYGWNATSGSSPSFDPLIVNDDEAIVAFQVLRELNHSITIAPLSRFYQHALDVEGIDRDNRTKEFIQAIKATVAFSVLWRSARGGTANIDSHYRDIMRIGVSSNNQNIPPLARHPQGQLGTLSLVDYKEALRFVLKTNGNIHTKAEWVDFVSQVAIYKQPKLARFLLFCASNDSMPDDSKPGLIKKARLGYNSMLKMSLWNDNTYFTIEHIAPRSQSDGWESDIYSDIYQDPRIIDMLGNLILLPQEENSVIGNRSWEHKRLMYKLLSSDTPEEFDQIKTELSQKSLPLTNTANKILNNSKYLGICKSVAVLSEDQKWTLEIIQERTKCFAGLAWDRLQPWLFA